MIEAGFRGIVFEAGGQNLAQSCEGVRGSGIITVSNDNGGDGDGINFTFLFHCDLLLNHTRSIQFCVDGDLIDDTIRVVVIDSLNC